MVSARPRDPKGKIVALDKLERILSRRGKKKIVFTNGVFDLLHPGHVSLLAAARRLGDMLVVGVNSDASVRRLKGPERPFIPARKRALMLAALEAVDFVVVFSEDTPLRVIQRVLPDILVKGGEWKQGSIVGAEIVEARGGRVVRMKMMGGISTTALARSIRGG